MKLALQANAVRLAYSRLVPYSQHMQAVITAEFLENIPASIRQRLKLKPGTVMDFDEQAPFLKGVPADPATANELVEFQTWLTSSVGLARGKFTTDDRMKETRGED